MKTLHVESVSLGREYSILRNGVLLFSNLQLDLEPAMFVSKNFRIAARCPSINLKNIMIKNYQDEYSRVMDVGDAILAREMKFLHFTHPPPAVILCLSEDGDYSNSLEYMAKRGYKVLLAESERENESPFRTTPLRVYSNGIWYWKKLIVGEGPCKTQIVHF